MSTAEYAGEGAGYEYQPCGGARGVEHADRVLRVRRRRVAVAERAPALRKRACEQRIRLAEPDGERASVGDRLA